MNLPEFPRSGTKELRLRLRLGCRLSFDLPAPTPMILMLNVHHSRAADLERPDVLLTDPQVETECFNDEFGNFCQRLVAPAGCLTVQTDGIIRDSGCSDPVGMTAEQHAVEDLPAEALGFLLPSRYCESDTLSDFAWRAFGNGPEGWGRVQAICDFVHEYVTFGYENSCATRTAAQTLKEGVGVCRDYTHLAIALCRSLNIPARYCTGYISDVGQPPPYPPMDFCAWMEVFLGGQWWSFDPRNNDTRYGRVLVGRGRDAADVPLIHTFGSHTLSGFEVWIDEATDGPL